jgi:hypothetical protein
MKKCLQGRRSVQELEQPFRFGVVRGSYLRKPYISDNFSDGSDLEKLGKGCGGYRSLYELD